MNQREIALRLQVADATVRALVRAAGFSDRHQDFNDTQVERILRAHDLRKHGYTYKEIPGLLEQEHRMSSPNGAQATQFDHHNTHPDKGESSTENLMANLENPHDKVIQHIVHQAELDADVAASIYRTAFHRRFVEQITQGDAIDAIDVGNDLSLVNRARELGYLPPASSQENPELESLSSIESITDNSPLESVLVSYSASV